MKKFVVLFLFATIVVIAGCGGGGGGSAATTPTSATIRQLQSGDYLTYNLAGTITQLGTATTSPVTGTLAISTYADSANAEFSGRRLKEIATITLTGNGGAYTGNNTVLIEQVTDGTIYDLGSSDNQIVSTSDNDPIEYKSPLAIGYAHSYSPTYQDATSEENAFTVVSLESVNGQSAYKIHSTTTSGDDSSSGDDWFVPDWGYPAKGTGAFQVTDGTHSYYFSGTMTLASKNF